MTESCECTDGNTGYVKRGEFLIVDNRAVAASFYWLDYVGLWITVRLQPVLLVRVCRLVDNRAVATSFTG